MINDSSLPELYSFAEVAELRIAHEQEKKRQFHQRVEAIQAELEPDDIDPTFWGIDKEAWNQLEPDTQLAVAASRIARDIDVMSQANIDPEVWNEMSLEDRMVYFAPQNQDATT